MKFSNEEVYGAFTPCVFEVFDRPYKKELIDYWDQLSFVRKQVAEQILGSIEATAVLFGGKLQVWNEAGDALATGSCFGDGKQRFAPGTIVRTSFVRASDKLSSLTSVVLDGERMTVPPGAELLTTMNSLYVFFPRIPDVGPFAAKDQ